MKDTVCDGIGVIARQNSLDNREDVAEVEQDLKTQWMVGG